MGQNAELPDGQLMMVRQTGADQWTFDRIKCDKPPIDQPPPAPPPSNDWRNGWTKHAESKIGWLPMDFNGSHMTWIPNNQLSAEERRQSFGIAHAVGNEFGPAVYRQINAGQPVWNCRREIEPIWTWPPATEAIHLTWKHYYPAQLWAGNGKRFGVRSQGTAGNGSINGKPDYGTGPGGLGADGGWSFRYSPIRKSSNDRDGQLRRYGNYAYCQNRGSRFRAPGWDDPSARVFGKTWQVEGASGDHDQWVRMGVTIIMNTANAENGELIMAREGKVIFRQDRIMWQRDPVANAPFAFYWAWMHGGNEDQDLHIPTRSFREYYKGFAAGYTTRANALEHLTP